MWTIEVFSYLFVSVDKKTRIVIIKNNLTNIG